MPPGRAPVQRQLFCRSPWWRWAGCGSTRGACGTARFPHGGRVGHGCAGSAIAREADGRQDVGGGRRGGGDERVGGAQGDEAEVLSTLLAERYERRSVMVTSNLVFSPWDRNVRAPSRLSPVRYVTVWSSRGVDERGAAGALPGAAEGRRVPDPVPTRITVADAPSAVRRPPPATSATTAKPGRHCQSAKLVEDRLDDMLKAQRHLHRPDPSPLPPAQQPPASSPPVCPPLPKPLTDGAANMTHSSRRPAH